MPALSLVLPLVLPCLLLGTRAAVAHGGEPHAGGYPWTFDPWIVVPLVAFGGLYGVGMMRLAARTRDVRALLPRALLGLAGILVLAGALVSPLHWLGEHLFTFHMIEHEIVMAVAAPLLVLARPVAAVLWALPAGERHTLATAMGSASIRRAWAWLTRGATATLLHGVAIWAWHVPALFDAAVTDTAMHRLQHLSFFATAVLFWWAVIWRCDRGAAAWHLFVTMIHTSVLGALMALAPRVLYLAQSEAAAEWGLTPIEDQQLAGIIMWIPAGIVYAGAALVMLALWIRRAGKGRVMPEQRLRRLPWIWTAAMALAAGTAAVGAALILRPRRARRAAPLSVPVSEPMVRSASPVPAVAAVLILMLATVTFLSVDKMRKDHTKSAVARHMTGGSADRAPMIFRRYGCAGCHTIPGIPGADGQTGPPLTGLSRRVHIAGVAENRPDNLVAWIVSPETFSPRTAMPTTGISEQEARDLAAFLYAR